jgi:deoxyribonuclease V
VLAVTDVAYFGGAAFSSRVLAPAWDAQFPTDVRVVLRTPVLDYVLGEFWRRELPCLLQVLEGDTPGVIVVDGYVWLDGDGRKGLGAHLHDALGVPVVGVAKQRFDGSAHARAITRGTSRAPLFVTAVGIPLDAAAERVVAMHGPHRIPTLLATADRAARAGVVRG